MFANIFPFFRRKPVVSTRFSEFIRTARPSEKKRVYTEVLKKATERQNALVSGHYRVTK